MVWRRLGSDRIALGPVSGQQSSPVRACIKVFLPLMAELFPHHTHRLTRSVVLMLSSFPLPSRTIYVYATALSINPALQSESSPSPLTLF
jgi:hypothetical protein